MFLIFSAVFAIAADAVIITVCSSGCSYTSIQPAIDFASNGDTINVYPGTYDQDEANDRDAINGGTGTSDFNIFVDKSVTIQGVDATGVPITNASNVQAFIIPKRNMPLGQLSTIFVQADDVTITGIDITAFNDPDYNFKTISVIGDNCIIKNSNFHTLDQVSSIYIYDPRYIESTDTSHIESYRFESNYFNADGIYASGIRISSGPGWTGDASNRIISGNVFNAGSYGIEFVGPGGDPWDIYPVGAATINSNTFSNQDKGSVAAWGRYDDSQGYGAIDWNSIISSNNFDKAVLVKAPDGSVRPYDSAPFYFVRGIYSAIQRYPINRVAQNGDTIDVAAGNYDEDIVIDKGITLQSISGASNTIISGGSQVIMINSDNVVIDGFTITNSNTSGRGVHSTDHSDITIKNNIIKDIGLDGDDVTGRGIEIISSLADVDNVQILNNEISHITGGRRTGSASASSSAMSIGWRAGNEDITNLLIQGNTIFDIKADTSPWTNITKGQGANGIMIDHAVTGTGRTVAPRILDNTIYDLEGLWSHAIGLEGNTPNALVEGNTIYDLTDHKSPADPDAAAIMVEDNVNAENVVIRNNNIDTSTVWLGVRNSVSGKTVNVQRNYWGSVNPNFTNVTMGSVNYGPWYIDSAMTTLNEEVTSCSPGDSETDNYGTDVGECSMGTRSRTCQADGSWGEWNITSSGVGPVAEICGNGVDNDCDGYTDAQDTDCSISDYYTKTQADNLFATLTNIADMATQSWVNGLGFITQTTADARYVLETELTTRIIAAVGNWAADKVNYYTIEQIDTYLASEKNERESADDELNEDIEAEALTRETDDTLLQNQINTVASSPASGITSNQITDWNTAFAWGNHASAGYVEEETDPAFSSWDKSTGISITESQISDLQDYLTSEADPSWDAEKDNYYNKAEINATFASEQQSRIDADNNLQSQTTSLENRAAHNANGVDIYLHQGWNTFKLPWFVLTGTEQVSELDLSNYDVETVLSTINGEYTYLAYYDGTNWQTFVPGNPAATSFTVFPANAANADFDFHIYINSADGARISIGMIGD